MTSQHLHITLHPESALLLLPDPVQPFADSVYTQRQIVCLPADDTASFIVLDWITEGRTARGECWELSRFESRNEVFIATSDGRQRLLLRDAVVLEGGEVGGEGLRGRMDGYACFASMIVRGGRFKGLVGRTMEVYRKEPRIGGRGFEERREGKRWDVVWSAAGVRGCMVVKVQGREVEEVRGFLRGVLEEDGEGDVVREFGEDALRCLW